MADDFMKALFSEAKRLEAELQQTPAYKQLQAVRTVIAAYEAGGARSPEPIRPKQIAPSVKPGTKTATIMEAAIAFLREKGSRATSGEVRKELAKRGIEVGGKNPSATMASYLSNSRLIDNIAGKGYGLVEWKSKDSAAETTESLL